MGSIVNLDSGVNIQTFPGAKFEVVDEPPPAQCSEAKIESITGYVTAISSRLRDTGKFVGYALTDKFVTITVPVEHAGTYLITGNGDDFVDQTHFFIDETTDIEYYIHNGGSLILTRNVESFAQFVHAAGYAFTIKGGKLYTDMPSGQLKDACTILFDPLT